MRLRNLRFVPAVAVCSVVLGAACSSDDEAATRAANPSTVVTTNSVESATDTVVRYPDVVDVTANFDAVSMTWSFAVTLSSPYDSADRYADGWRVMGSDGTVYGIHTLAHDHANEQPFTRRQSNVVIPSGVDEVVVEGRDQKYGFGGATFVVALHTG